MVIEFTVLLSNEMQIPYISTKYRQNSPVIEQFIMLLISY